MTARGLLSRSGELLRPVDAASLGVLRIAFGIFMALDIFAHWAQGWIRDQYITPLFHFKYYGFSWVYPFQPSMLYGYFFVLGLLAVCIGVGFFYRVAAALFAIGFAYWFLMDQTEYLNHFYLITILSFLLVFVPAHRAFSIDARRRPAPATVPLWALWLVRFQVAVPYFFGGIAKMNADWVRGEPMRLWLHEDAQMRPIFAILDNEAAVLFFSIGGLLFDLAIVPLLVWKRTRRWAYVACLTFHVMNAFLFKIGVFPWLMIAATTVFFEPGWPRRFLRKEPKGQKVPPAEAAPVLTPARRLGVAALAAWVLVQVLVPFRHFLYPGPVSWNEAGHRFSWHMKLRDKRGRMEVWVRDPATGEEWWIDPLHFLTRRQATQMIGQPDMILQFSHHVARYYRRKGRNVEVRMKVWISLNGRKPQFLVDPTVDLASQPRTSGDYPWITELVEKLP